MPYLSVIVNTNRVGGLDVLFESLLNQTFKDFELVLVDGLFRSRRAVIPSIETIYPFKVKHVEPLNNQFPVTAFCRSANTGIVHASGEICLILADYSWVPHTVLEKHAQFHKTQVGTAGFMGPHQNLQFPKTCSSFPKYEPTDDVTDGGSWIDSYNEDVSSGKLNSMMWSVFESPIKRIDNPIETLGLCRFQPNIDPKLRLEYGSVSGTYNNCKNESVRTEHLLAINGFDEKLDGTSPYQDTDIGDRLSYIARVSWTLDPSNIVYIINPRAVFPKPRRTRPCDTNRQIWEGMRAAGYPNPNNWNLRLIRDLLCFNDLGVYQ